MIPELGEWQNWQNTWYKLRDNVHIACLWPRLSWWLKLGPFLTHTLLNYVLAVVTHEAKSQTEPVFSE